MRLFRNLLITFALGAFFLGCEPFLLYEEQVPEFKAPADKALCVVYRPSGMYNQVAKIYCDKKFITGTTGNTLTSFEVDPGEHLILAKIDIMAKVKFNFEAGKIYYIAQVAFPIPIGITTLVSNTLSPRTCADAAEKLESEKGKLRYTKFNPNFGEVEDLDDDDYEEEMEDYKEWQEKEPEDAKKEAEYQGC